MLQVFTPALMSNFRSLVAFHAFVQQAVEDARSLSAEEREQGSAELIREIDLYWKCLSGLPPTPPTPAVSREVSYSHDNSEKEDQEVEWDIEIPESEDELEVMSSPSSPHAAEPPAAAEPSTSPEPDLRPFSQRLRDLGSNPFTSTAPPCMTYQPSFLPQLGTGHIQVNGRNLSYLLSESQQKAVEQMYNRT